MPPIALPFAVQFMRAKEKYNPPSNCTSADNSAVTATSNADNKTSGANKVNMPANARARLLDVIKIFVFIYLPQVKRFKVQYQTCPCTDYILICFFNLPA
jgi:hypothetical protein